MVNTLLVIIITIAILIVIFLLFREINCWYWKINERIGIQKEQNILLKQILNNSTNDNKKDTDSIGDIKSFKETKKESKSKDSNLNEKVNLKKSIRSSSLDPKVNKKEGEKGDIPKLKPKRKVKILQNEVKTTLSENEEIKELGQDILSDEIIVMNLESRNIRIMKRHLYVSSEYWGIVVEG